MSHEESSFEKELAQLINKYNMENSCDMPDFLIAEMVIAFLVTCGVYIKKNLDWHGCNSVCHPKEGE